MTALFSCQSRAEDGQITVNEPIETSVAEPAESEDNGADEVQEPPVTEEAEGEVPVSLTYLYMGYELSIDAFDGYAYIYYPSAASDGDVEAFLAAEAEKYQVSGVVYSFEGDGVLRLDYPKGIAAEERKALADTLANDLIIYVTPAPAVVPETAVLSVYSYKGYELSAEIKPGETVLVYPDFVTDEEVEAFFAFENAKYDFAALGVSYSLPSPGKAVLTYPDDYTGEIVSAELDVLVNDLIAYITAVPEDVVEAEGEAVRISEVYTYQGYRVEAVIEEGRTELTYPAVPDEEAEAFIALENERYGLASLGIVYEITEPGKAVFTYPESITPETVAAELDVLISDLITYVTPAPQVVEIVMPEPAEEDVAEPVVKTYSYLGYTVEALIEEGRTELTYPAVPNEEAEAFIALENEKYGLASLGIVYEITEPGKAVFTYPESIVPETVAAELDVLISDLIAYVTAPAEAEEVPAAVVDVPVEEASEEEIEYPFGIEPIVKAEGDTDGFHLYIGHTNDVHGRITAGEDGSMGYAKLDTLVKTARGVTDNILLLDGGDTLHGTNLANMFEGQTVLEIMADIGYDAMVPGNHDFNYGAERLFEAAEWAEENSSLRILSANITDENGYLLLQPYQIYDFNGFKVAVIGLTTPDTKTKSHPKNTEGVEFMNDVVVDNAQYAIDLMNELADFIIVLGHIGVVPDGDSGLTSEIICENIDGIDLFIDAHSHTVMDGGEMVNGTLIVSTGQYLNNLGIVDISVEADGDATIADAFLLPAAEVLDPSSGTFLESFGITEVEDDPEIVAYVEAKQAELDDMLGKVVARIPMDLNGERGDVRTGKTNLSSLICEAMTSESGADFTITNGGGIRASLKAGPVTLGDINNVLPFTNIITVCEITPQDVYAALEHGYSMLPEENGAFSQTDLKVVYSASSPAGERIKKVYLGDTLLDRNDNETTYKVASNDFMAAGGDGYTMFGRVLTEGGMLNEVFADYLAALYPAN